MIDRPSLWLPENERAQVLMRKTAKIIHIDPNGSNGLREWEQMDYKNLVSRTPVQRGHLYHEIQEQGYMVAFGTVLPLQTELCPIPSMNICCFSQVM